MTLSLFKIDVYSKDALKERERQKDEGGKEKTRVGRRAMRLREVQETNVPFTKHQNERMLKISIKSSSIMLSTKILITEMWFIFVQEIVFRMD